MVVVVDSTTASVTARVKTASTDIARMKREIEVVEAEKEVVADVMKVETLVVIAEETITSVGVKKEMTTRLVGRDGVAAVDTLAFQQAHLE